MPALFRRFGPKATSRRQFKTNHLTAVSRLQVSCFQDWFRRRRSNALVGGTHAANRRTATPLKLLNLLSYGRNIREEIPMRSMLALAAVALLSVCYCEPTFAAKPVILALNPQPEPPGVRLPPGPCRGANGKFMRCAGPAVREDPLGSIYGSTVLVTNNRNQTEKLWFKPDHTFTWEGPKGQRGRGTWTLADDGRRICLTPGADQKPTEPGQSRRARCTELSAGHKGGERWEQRNDIGESISIKIRQGM